MVKQTCSSGHKSRSFGPLTVTSKRPSKEPLSVIGSGQLAHSQG